MPKVQHCYVIAAGLFGTIFIGLVIILFPFLQNLAKTDEVIDFSKFLVFQSNNSAIYAINVETKRYKRLMDENEAKNVSAFGFYGRKTMFYAYKDSRGGPIKSLSKSFKDLEIPVNRHIDSIAVDSTKGVLYVMDKTKGEIFAIDIKSKKYILRFRGFDKMKDIAVDSKRRLLFALTTNKIWKGDLDVSILSPILEVRNNFTMSRFAIDESRATIYTVKGNSSGVSTGEIVDYEGKFVGRFLDYDGKVEIDNLAVFNETLFWTRTTFDSVEKTEMMSRKIEDDYANPSPDCLVDQLTYGKISGLKAYDFDKL